MKIFAAIIIMTWAFVPGLCFAQEPSNAPDPSWEVRETNLTEVSVEAIDGADLIHLDDETLTTKKGRSYTLRGVDVDSLSISKMRQLSPEQQKNFQEIRLNILKRMTAILDSQSLTIGAGIATKNKLMGLFKKKDPSRVQQTVREVGMLSVEKILNSINAKFWTESVKIADAKEVTFFMTPLGQISLGLPKVAVGGSLGVTFAIGYNKVNDVMFLDILANMERLRSGFVVFAGFKVLTGLHFDSSVKSAARFKAQRGETFFPIVIPAWDGTGADYYSFGVSTAVGLPPPPITELFTYKMNTQRMRLLRLGITTVPLWTLVYNSLKGLNASKELLLKFAKKANMDLSILSCASTF